MKMYRLLFAVGLLLLVSPASYGQFDELRRQVQDVVKDAVGDKLNSRTTDMDGEWNAQKIVMRNTPEADVVIRVGDIDNLGYWWPEGFDPFTGKSTPEHPWPFTPESDDHGGTDQIYVGTKFRTRPAESSGDGYSQYFDQNKPATPLRISFSIDAQDLKLMLTAQVKMFVDDFQSPSLSSRFSAKLNGKRFSELERVLNTIDQSGPIGKVVTIMIPQELSSTLSNGDFALEIDDETTGRPDGFAIDFLKLLINPKKVEWGTKVAGTVIDAETGKPIAGATIVSGGVPDGQTDNNGAFAIGNVPPGLATVNASARGYNALSLVFDVSSGQEAPPQVFRLKRAAEVSFQGRTLTEGDSLELKSVQFDKSSAELLSSGKAELDKLTQFMKENAQVEIELSGHTSSEGTVESNRELSLSRVLSCKAYLISRGISESRIRAIGYGPDRPVAPNDSPENRARNRRVELRITRVQ